MLMSIICNFDSFKERPEHFFPIRFLPIITDMCTDTGST